MTLTKMKSASSKPLLILSEPLWSYLYSYLELCVTDPTFCLLMNEDDASMMEILLDDDVRDLWMILKKVTFFTKSLYFPVPRFLNEMS